MAEVTGGRYTPTVREIFDPHQRVALEVLRLWPYLLTAALLLLVLDVTLKRIDFSFGSFGFGS